VGIATSEPGDPPRVLTVVDPMIDPRPRFGQSPANNPTTVRPGSRRCAGGFGG